MTIERIDHDSALLFWFGRTGAGVFPAPTAIAAELRRELGVSLVGQTEADAKIGRISYSSPLGRALIGRTVGEEVEVSAPSGDKYYVIKKVEFI